MSFKINNSINKSCTSFTSNSIALGKVILLTKETQTSFKSACLGGSSGVEVQILTSYISWINWVMSCRLAKHCFFLLFRVYLKNTGLFQEHEKEYFNMHSSEVFISRDNFCSFSQSFQWTTCKLLWPISHKIALSLTCLPVNKILFAVFLYISTYLSFCTFRKTNKNLIVLFPHPSKVNISS